MGSNPWLNGFFLNDWLRNRNFPNVCFQRVFCQMVFCRTELISLLIFAEYKLPIVRFPNKLFPITKFPNIFCRIVLPNGSVSECLFCRMVFCRMGKLRIVVAEWPTLSISIVYIWISIARPIGSMDKDWKSSIEPCVKNISIFNITIIFVTKIFIAKQSFRNSFSDFDWLITNKSDSFEGTFRSGIHIQLW